MQAPSSVTAGHNLAGASLNDFIGNAGSGLEAILGF
jgi:hypothetical protein